MNEVKLVKVMNIGHTIVSLNDKINEALLEYEEDKYKIINMQLDEDSVYIFLQSKY